MLVEIDTSVKPIDAFEVRLTAGTVYTQYVVYENLPKFCRHCIYFGHYKDNYKYFHKTPSSETEIHLEVLDKKRLKKNQVALVHGSTPLEALNEKAAGTNLPEENFDTSLAEIEKHSSNPPGNIEIDQISMSQDQTTKNKKDDDFVLQELNPIGDIVANLDSDEAQLLIPPLLFHLFTLSMKPL